MKTHQIALSPLMVEMLLHFRCVSEPYPNQSAPAQVDAIKTMICSDIIIAGSDGLYHTTPKGDAWVKAILNTPMPRMAYVDEQGRVIE